MQAKNLLLLFALGLFQLSGHVYAGLTFAKNDTKSKTVVFGNSGIRMTLGYDMKCTITQMEVNGQKVIEGGQGIYDQIKVEGNTFSTLKLVEMPKVETYGQTIKIGGIRYGNMDLLFSENWIFTLTDDDIVLEIERSIPAEVLADEVSFPAIGFKSIHTWEGAFLGTGGVAWMYLFTGQDFTYGVHTGYSAFWNSKSGNGLKVDISSPGKHIAGRYTRSDKDQLVYRASVSDSELIPRYDADTHRRRFIRGNSDVWSPFAIPAGKFTQTIRLSAFDYQNEYSRGKFVGIDGDRVTAVMNTIARIGVIDAKHYGGNSWHTPYGPICLHEQYIGQFNIGINDDRYLNGYKECLDYYRDNAMRPDGRVISRWAYDNSDAMAGTVAPKGFYEAQWGYLMDSNPDFVINVAELYDQCGDLEWVARHQANCEKVLEFMLKRDINGNHLVEMMTDNHTDKKGSDWIDIIWASFENAFVNAEMYRALVLWSDIERQLGNEPKAAYYQDYAEKLKVSFNKSTKEGGFWDEGKRCYIHWRDKDNSIHGNNLVTPVNFMAIAYGICDDRNRTRAILDQIENQMQKENLFFWPICMFSYELGDGNDWQFPFPNYENGDIFLSWGSVAVQAYAGYNPELALKYVKNVLKRHSEDGLAFQRYGRVHQDGMGDDILSGNSLVVVGLYQSIYGTNPLYNRFYLNPHITKELSGTELLYNYRGDKLTIGLEMNLNRISNAQFSIAMAGDFGFNARANELEFFNSKEETRSLLAQTEGGQKLSIDIVNWRDGQFGWIQSSEKDGAKVNYSLSQLKVDHTYTLTIDGIEIEKVKSNGQGDLRLSLSAGKYPQKIRVSEQ